MIGAYVPDLINLVGALISVLGFLYVTYDLLKRERLQLLTRLLAPALIGGVILVPFGALDYIVFGDTNHVIQGVILFGLVGVMIGLFNGSFVRWAPQENKSALQGFLEGVKKWRWVQNRPSLEHWMSKGIVELSDRRSRYSKKKRTEEINKPPFFSWGDALIGLFIAFPTWLAVDFLFDFPFVQGFVFGICLALAGGIFAGIWRFINWEPSSLTEKLSWPGGVIGFVAASILGYFVLFMPSDTPVPAFIAVLFLAFSGAIAGALWRYSGMPDIGEYLKGKFQTLFEKASIPADKPATVLIGTISADKSPTLSADPSLATIPNDKDSIPSTDKLLPSSSREEPTDTVTVSPSTDATSMPKAPPFSWRGCLIGLFSAFSFGLASALLANILVCFSCTDNVSGALTSASFIGLAGAATGGLSRYIFDWANHLEKDRLLLIGGFITLLGFALQALPPLLHLLGISGQ
jgi:hypothetical protein